jgi:hypothetical protein
MKRNIWIIVLFLTGILPVYSQYQVLPMRYQILLKGTNGNTLNADSVHLRLSVLKGDTNGITVYSEYHQLAPGTSGIMNMSIGEGTPLSGNYQSIEWGKDDYYLKTELDTALNGNYSILMISRFLGVPYAAQSQYTHAIHIYTQEEISQLNGLHAGVIVFNSTYNTLQFYTGAQWKCVSPPSQANAGPDIIISEGGGTTAILNAVAPGSGQGTWSVVSGPSVQFSDIHDPQASFSGSPNTKYVLKWTVSNGCESTNDLMEVRMGFVCGSSTVSFVYHNMYLTYGTIEVPHYTWNNTSWVYTPKCILDRNLGASRVATSSNDNLSYGDYYQWGRNSDFHELMNSGLTFTLSPSDVPGHPDYISPTVSPFDWRNPPNTGLWQNGYNSPCPDNWHIITNNEWHQLFPNGLTIADAFEIMKLPAAGYRSYNGTMYDQGVEGRYWDTDYNEFDGRSFQTLISNTNWGSLQLGIGYRADATPIRCIKNE